jgi:hypothetical protein
MAEVLFKWLKIKPNEYVIDFRDELEFPKSAGDTAGFYRKTENETSSSSVQSIRLIRSKWVRPWPTS